MLYRLKVKIIGEQIKYSKNKIDETYTVIATDYILCDITTTSYLGQDPRSS